jgi:hypothetical protein
MRTRPSRCPNRPPAHPEGAVSTNPRVSMRSGGGGERDEKHSHVDPCAPRSRTRPTVRARARSTAPIRENRSRRDRAADARAAEGEGVEPEGDPEGDEDLADIGDDTATDDVDLLVILNTDSSVQGTEGLGRYVERVVRGRLRNLAPHLTRVEAHLTDASRSRPVRKISGAASRPGRGMPSPWGLITPLPPRRKRCAVRPASSRGCSARSSAAATTPRAPTRSEARTACRPSAPRARPHPRRAASIAAMSIFLIAHHRFEGAPRRVAAGGDRRREYARRDLPGHAPPVLAPAAGALLAAIADDRIPVAIGLRLVVGRDLEGERLGVLERRPAIEPDAGHTGDA